MRKLTLDVDGTEVGQSPPAVFEQRTMTSGEPRLVASVPDDQADLLQALAGLLQPPLYVLYVLHTPRGEGEPGRYQSTELTAEELGGFLARYQAFFADDARHDLWVYSPETRQTLVWDRHNLLYAEGQPLDAFAATLVARGFRNGRLEPLGDHIHHYRAEYDAEAAGVLDAFDWYRTPLREDDLQ